LNTRRRSGIYIDVRFLRTVLTVLLALAWMPLTAHCQLERLTDLQELRCESKATDSTPDTSHCGDDCCSWETAQYRLSSVQPLPTAPLLAVVAATLVSLEQEDAHSLQPSAPPTAPPRPPKPWQFSLRAALPVRAPSIAS